MSKIDDLIEKTRTNTDEVLTSDEFLTENKFATFYTYFIKDNANPYRQTRHFRMFQQMNRDREQNLTTKITNFENNLNPEEFPNPNYKWVEVIKQFGKELFESYELMREYVPKDWLLFRDLDYP